MNCLPREFYDRHAVTVARDLLGCTLVRRQNGGCLAARIVETEAYHGEDDLGCHASRGRTPRTAIMYAEPGRAYIYFTYGMHWLLNAVTAAVGTPSAVLIRAVQPIAGLEQMQVNRPRLARTAGWTDGPAKLTQALALDGAWNGADLCDPAGDVFLASGSPVPEGGVLTGPRVGLFHVPEPWKSISWRFLVKAGI